MIRTEVRDQNYGDQRSEVRTTETRDQKSEPRRSEGRDIRNRGQKKTEVRTTDVGSQRHRNQRSEPQGKIHGIEHRVRSDKLIAFMGLIRCFCCLWSKEISLYPMGNRQWAMR